ncbi:MAG: 5'/3'-nucleotidase SurE [Pseudomonadota bacterium]
MRILITNDDGITAPGFAVLERIAAEVAGSADNVWVVAPGFEQSGVGHCINYTRPTLITEMGKQRFAIEGSPADCVLVGLHEVMADAKPDLILSGVNRGNNAGENTLYSGTIGACIEAVLQGVNAIALSQFYGPAYATAENAFEAAQVHGPAVIRNLIDNGIWTEDPYRVFYNVNFPPVMAADVKGHQVVSQGFRPTTRFRTEAFTAPNRRKYTWITGGNQQEPTGLGTDVQANIDGYTSITPMRVDLTAHDLLDDLKARLS